MLITKLGADIVLLPSCHLFFFCSQLALWVETEKKPKTTNHHTFFPLYNSRSHNWKHLRCLPHDFLLKIIQTAVLSITTFWVVLPWPSTNKSKSFLKENHCIFTWDQLHAFSALFIQPNKVYTLLSAAKHCWLTFCLERRKGSSAPSLMHRTLGSETGSSNPRLS